VTFVSLCINTYKTDRLSSDFCVTLYKYIQDRQTDRKTDCQVTFVSLCINTYKTDRRSQTDRQTDLSVIYTPQIFSRMVLMQGSSALCTLNTVLLQSAIICLQNRVLLYGENKRNATHNYTLRITEFHNSRHYIKLIIYRRQVRYRSY